MPRLTDEQRGDAFSVAGKWAADSNPEWQGCRVSMLALDLHDENEALKRKLAYEREKVDELEELLESRDTEVNELRTVLGWAKKTIKNLTTGELDEYDEETITMVESTLAEPSFPGYDLSEAHEWNPVQCEVYSKWVDGASDALDAIRQRRDHPDPDAQGREQDSAWRNR